MAPFSYIDSVGVDETFYLGDDLDDGEGVRLRDMKYNILAGVNTHINSNIALALIQRCCAARKGKVFYFGSESSGLPDRLAAINNLLPDLIYVPGGWSQDEKDKWFSLPHRARLELLNGQSGLIEETMPAMPIQLLIGNKNADAHAARLGHSIDVRLPIQTVCNVTLSINPEAHSALTKTLRIGTDVGGSGPEYIRLKSDLTNFRYRSGDAIVKRLDEMWLEGTKAMPGTDQEGTLQVHSAVLKLAIDFGIELQAHYNATGHVDVEPLRAGLSIAGKNRDWPMNSMTAF